MVQKNVTLEYVRKKYYSPDNFLTRYQSTRRKHQKVLHKTVTLQLKRLLQESNQLNRLHDCTTNLSLIIIELHLYYKSLVNRNENAGW